MEVTRWRSSDRHRRGTIFRRDNDLYRMAVLLHEDEGVF